MSVYRITRAISELTEIASRIESCANDYDFDTADYWDDPYVKDQRDRFSAAMRHVANSKEALEQVLNNLK